MLQGLKGERNILNIIIPSESDDEHDKTCESLFAETEGELTEKERVLIVKSTVEFFGNKFSVQGIALHPKKISAIKEAGRLTDKHLVRSFLVMVKYIQQYIQIWLL